MLVSEFGNSSYHVKLFGRFLAPAQSPQIDQGMLFGLQPPGFKHAIMVAPKLPADQYRCVEHTGGTYPIIYSDAVILTLPKQSIAFATSDCGATILFARDTGAVVLMHTGRNQLMNTAVPDERVSIIEAGIKALTDDGADVLAISACSISQIAAKDFPHRGHQDAFAVLKQRKLWGKKIVPNEDDITLDLRVLIRNQLMYFGIASSNIVSDNSNPYTSPDLYSKRGGKIGSNAIMLSRN